jgi:hypothetical protein
MYCHVASHITDIMLHSHRLFFKIINTQLNWKNDINHVTSEVLMVATMKSASQAIAGYGGTQN